MHITSIRSGFGTKHGANPAAPSHSLPSVSGNSANPRGAGYLPPISWRIRITLLLLCALPATMFGQSQLTAPISGSVLTGSSVAFGWTATAGATAYSLWLGSTGAGSVDLYNSHATSATSITATGMPTNGETVYARLYTIFGTKSVSVDYTFKAITQSQIVLTSPPPGSTLTGSTATFAWNATAGASYSLWLGSTGVGSYNLYDSHTTAATTVKVTGLPTNGETIYAQINTIINGNSVHNDYTFTAAGAIPVLSALSCSSAGLTGAANDSCTVTLSGPAPRDRISGQPVQQRCGSHAAGHGHGLCECDQRRFHCDRGLCRNERDRNAESDFRQHLQDFSPAVESHGADTDRYDFKLTVHLRHCGDIDGDNLQRPQRHSDLL
jgi:hypothetical protein